MSASDLAGLGLMGLRGLGSLLAARLREHRHDRRLAISTTERFVRVRTFAAAAPPAGDLGSRYRDPSGYEATSYPRLTALADYLGVGGGDVFLDIGCGSGRAVCFMAARGARKAIGLEILPELAEKARANAAAVMKRGAAPIEIVPCDAAAAPAGIVDDATVLFLFNPFGFRTLKAVVDGLRESLRRKPRRMTIAYYNPVHRWYLDDQPWLVEDGALAQPHDIAIWRSRPGHDDEDGV